MRDLQHGELGVISLLLSGVRRFTALAACTLCCSLLHFAQAPLVCSVEKPLCCFRQRSDVCGVRHPHELGRLLRRS